MKLKNIIIVLVSIVFLLSCYQAPESSSGSITVKLNSDIMRDAPDGFDGELVLAVFPEGDIESLIDYSTGGTYDEASTVISYLDAFPTPLLANNSVPFSGRSGVLSLLNVPSNRPLTLLVEHYGGLYGVNGTYYHSYSGVSEAFEVAGGGTAEVAITLTPTARGSVKLDRGSTSANFYAVFDPEDYDSFITMSGSEITNLNTETTFLTLDYGTVDGSFIITQEAILPGKKLRIIFCQYNAINAEESVGISDTFELQPGLEKSVNATYYMTANNCVFSYYSFC